MQFALARSSGHSSSPQMQARSANDRALQDAIREVVRSREEFAEMNEHVRQIVNLPINRTKSLVARTLHFIIPQRFYSALPRRITKMISEELCTLEATEGLFRARVNNIQLGTLNLTRAIREKGKELAELQRKIDTAKDSGWTAREIHEYILTQAGFDVHPEISELLDNKFDVLTEEEKESHRQRLLAQLDGNIAAGKSLVVMGVRACYAALEMFETGAGEYFNYVNVYKPMAAIRNAAVTLIETSDVMHSAKDALMMTGATSIKAIENALEYARRCRSHSIVSADMIQLLETGDERIDSKLKLIAREDQERLKSLPSVSAVKRDTEDKHIVEAVPIASVTP